MFIHVRPDKTKKNCLILANKTVVNSKKIGVPIEKIDTKITIPGMLHKIKTEPKHRYRSSPASAAKTPYPNIAELIPMPGKPKPVKIPFLKGLYFLFTDKFFLFKLLLLDQSQLKHLQQVQLHQYMF